MSLPPEPLGLRLLGIIAPSLLAIGALGIHLHQLWLLYVALSVAYVYVFEFGCGTHPIACIAASLLAIIATILPFFERKKKRLANQPLRAKDGGDTHG